MLDIFSMLTAKPELLELRILLSLIGMGMFTYYDLFNSKNVPENMCYGFLAVAIIFNLFVQDTLPIGFGLALIISLFTLPFYFSGQIGGADLFAMAGLALLIPVLPNPLLQEGNASNFQLPVIFNTLFYAFFLFLVYMVAGYVPKIIKRVMDGRIKLSNAKLANGILYLVAYGIIIYVIVAMKLPASGKLLIGMVFAALATIFFTLFKDEINDTMIGSLKLDKIIEEDVLAIEKMDKEQVKKYGLERLINSKQLEKLKEISEKEGMNEFPVYTGYPPFMPFLTIGLILSILFGNIIM